MSKFFINVLFYLGFTTYLHAQGGNSIKRYCQINVMGKQNSSALRILIDTGQLFKFKNIRYPSIKTELETVKALTSTIDILNYMNSIGWVLLNANPPRNNASDFYDRYVFEKSISN